MRLADLNPRWFAETGREGQGITFDCPCCVGKPNAVRLAIAFAQPFDGGESVGLTPRRIWPLLWPPDGTPNTTTIPPGVHWGRTGDTFDTLSLMPSVDASPAGHWHGWVQNGEARGC